MRTKTRIQIENLIRDAVRSAWFKGNQEDKAAKERRAKWKSSIQDRVEYLENRLFAVESLLIASNVLGLICSCGNPRVILDTYRNNKKLSHLFQVRCTNCGRCGPGCDTAEAAVSTGWGDAS